MKQADCFHKISSAVLTLTLAAGLPSLAMPGGPGQGKSGEAHGKSGRSSMNRSTAGDLLEKNPKLAARLEALLPPGTDVPAASAGFRNLGQFVAAVHVSRNLGIPFDALKARLVEDKLSLGQAIHKLRPEADAAAEARKAEDQTAKDLASRG